MTKAIGAGETVLDIVFRERQAVEAVPGGSVFNSMTSLARVGLCSLFVSETGRDRVSGIVADFMCLNNMSDRYLTYYDGLASAVSLAFTAGDDTEYRFFRETPAKRQPFRLPAIEAGDVVLLGSYFAVNPALREEICRLQTAAREQGATIIYDINFRAAHASERETLLPAFCENLRAADIVRASVDDLALLFPDESRNEIYKNHLAGKLLIVTDGGREVWLKTGVLEKHYPVVEIRPVSTIGAGDSFNAGIAARLIADGVTPSDLRAPSETLCDRLVAEGMRFAAAACMSVENYVPTGFHFTNTSSTNR